MKPISLGAPIWWIIEGKKDKIVAEKLIDFNDFTENIFFHFIMTEEIHQKLAA